MIEYLPNPPGPVKPGNIVGFELPGLAFLAQRSGERIE
jgi:hypothetical protein